MGPSRYRLDLIEVYYYILLSQKAQNLYIGMAFSCECTGLRTGAAHTYCISSRERSHSIVRFKYTNNIFCLAIANTHCDK